MRVALVNGSSERGVSPWDRGLLYGDGVFETLRTYGGRLFALDEHLVLLEQSASLLKIDAARSVQLLREEAREALSMAGPGEKLLRLLLSRGEGAGAALRSEGEPTRIVLVEPLPLLPEELYLRGVRVCTAPELAAGPKTLAYLPRLLALELAREQGGVELLHLDPTEGLIQGSSCNLLWVRQGEVRAPLPRGGRAGVTRAHLLARLGSLGWRVEPRPVRLEDLGDAELLLCSTIREVLPVVAVGGVRVGEGQPGEAARLLRRILRQAAGE